MCGFGLASWLRCLHDGTATALRLVKQSESDISIACINQSVAPTLLCNSCWDSPMAWLLCAHGSCVGRREIDRASHEWNERMTVHIFLTCQKHTAIKNAFIPTSLAVLWRPHALRVLRGFGRKTTKPCLRTLSDSIISMISQQGSL